MLDIICGTDVSCCCIVITSLHESAVSTLSWSPYTSKYTSCHKTPVYNAVESFSSSFRYSWMAVANVWLFSYSDFSSLSFTSQGVGRDRMYNWQRPETLHAGQELHAIHMRSRDKLIYFPPICPIQWPETFNSETTSFPR